MKWRSLDRALRTVADYEACAREIPAVKWVKVRAASNDPKMKAGVVHLYVRGRGIGPFRLRLSKEDARRVLLHVVERHPIGVELKMK